jgi:hypothetical protein
MFTPADDFPAHDCNGKQKESSYGRAAETLYKQGYIHPKPTAITHSPELSKQCSSHLPFSAGSLRRSQKLRGVFLSFPKCPRELDFDSNLANYEGRLVFRKGFE